MLFEIKHRYTGSVLFALECVSLKLCIAAAVKSNSDLRWADLRGADLRGADLQGADLQGADLQGAYLRGADLRGADLQGADLQGAYLRGADLRGAYLQGAYLQGAYLQGAYLRGTNLQGAYLQGADLQGAKIRDDITITKEPIQISGLNWIVSIFDNHMQIGCELHSHEDWRGFSDDKWLEMGGKDALYLKREQFQMLIALCDQHRPK